MNNSFFGETMENVTKHRNNRLGKTDEKGSRLGSERSYHTTKRFSEILLAIEMKEAKVKMNKPVYLGMLILNISKTLMCKFLYDYIKLKHGDRAKLCYKDGDGFVIYIKTEDFLKDISTDVERWFDTSSYDENDKKPSFNSHK